MIHRAAQTLLFTIAAVIVVATSASAQVLIGETAARFDWDDAVGDVAFYEVLVSRSSRGGSYEVEQTVTSTSVIIDATVGEVVRVRVRAGNSSAFGPLSLPSDSVRFGLPPELPVEGTPGVFHGRVSGGDSGFIFYADPETGDVWRFSAVLAGTPAMLLGTHSDLTWQLFATGDFNGDGVSDLFFHHPSGATRIWYLFGDTYQQVIGPAYIGETWVAEITGDFDGNGQDDVIFREDAGSVQAWFRTDSVFESALFPSMSPSVELLTAGDFDGDGVDDVFWRDATTTDTLIWLIANDPYNGPYALTRMSQKRSMLWEVFETHDENGDGTEDVHWRMRGSHEVAQWWMMSGEQVLAQ